ncbi:DNA ligase 1-like [Eriocheir sinensis]|uniref:DNA ligase 1-like n=1 Tax=Eriocheir sinensis TaxID=95602 RepID=UPI0021C8BDFC|nr:DNA ligase 1-like [Eriocheir sinensis]XP_050717879.1 DNA ligase 1-like [Eriocheir sinensis]
MDFDAWLNSALDAYDKGKALPGVQEEEEDEEEEEEEEEEDPQPSTSSRNDKEPAKKKRSRSKELKDENFEGPFTTPNSSERKNTKKRNGTKHTVPYHEDKATGNLRRHRRQKKTQDKPNPFKDFVEIKIKRAKTWSSSSEDSYVISDDESVDEGLLEGLDTDHDTDLQDTWAKSEWSEKRKGGEGTSGKGRKTKTQNEKPGNVEKGNRTCETIDLTTVSTQEEEEGMKKEEKGTSGKVKKTKNQTEKPGKRGKGNRACQTIDLTTISAQEEKGISGERKDRAGERKRIYNPNTMTERVKIPEWRRGEGEKEGELSDIFEYRFLGAKLEPTIGFIGYPEPKKKVDMRPIKIPSPTTRKRKWKEWLMEYKKEMEGTKGTGGGRTEGVDEIEEEEEEEV